MGDYDADLALFSEFLAHLESAKQYAAWRRDNCGKGIGGTPSNPAAGTDVALWDAFVADIRAGRTPIAPDLKTAIGDAFVDAGKEHMALSRIVAQLTNPDNVPPAPPGPVEPPPPPPTSTGYFGDDYSSGQFLYNPWRSLLSYGGSGSGSNGSWNLSILGSTSGTVDDSVKIVDDPAGTSSKVARYRINDSDPPWPVVTTLQKAEAQSTVEWTWDNPNGATVGDVRWFQTRLYLPYTATEKFEWAHGGSNAFTDLGDLHPGNGTAWPAFSIQWYPDTNDINTWAKFRVAGGPTINSTQYLTEYRLFRVTDDFGDRDMSNHNRWITISWGMRMAADTSGWLEGWIDGVNVLPRVARPTMWGGDNGMYFKHGLYKRTDASFPESGSSTLYYDTVYIGTDRPF